MASILELFGKKLGRVTSFDAEKMKEKLMSFYNTNDRKQLFAHLYTDIGWGKDQNKELHWAFDETYPEAPGTSFFHMADNEEYQRDVYRKLVNECVANIERLFSYAQEFEQRVPYYFRDEVFTAVGTGGKIRYLLPSDCVAVEAEKNYEEICVAELRERVAGTSSAHLIPNDMAGLTVAQARKDAQMTLDAIQSQTSYIEDIKHAKTDELAQMQAEIDRQMAVLKARQEALMAEANKKLEELKLQKFQMETQIFMLDSEIYAIRCLLGETIDFTRLRSGNPAPKDTPLVVYQKVRYLDEELGKLSAIYDVDGNFEYLERFFAHSPYTFEFFTPALRSVSLVRISRTGQIIGNDDRPGMLNCLKAYDMEHGSCIGIMVRDGDNLYMGWTDETRVDVKEDMFMTPKTVTEPAKHGNKSDSEKSMLEIGMEKMNQAYPMVSRAFVFNILEGFISGEKGIIQFPEPVSVVEQLTNPTSPYVVFSAADGWLDDNRYGNMADILNRCNERLTEGDMLLMTRYIRPNQGQYYSNDRGRGYADRTHDCMLGDNAIYRLNLVEKTFEGHYLYVQFPPDKEKESIRYRNDYTSPNGSPYAFRRMTCQNSKGIEQDKKSIEKEGGTVVDECDVISTHYYVSAKKRYSDNARSNMEVYRDEIMNLTYMNTVWVLYLLTTRHTEGFRQFASATKYLNTALQYLREREETERKRIAAYYPDLDSISDWPVLMSEWKLAKNVREITDYQAKRFAKTLSATQKSAQFLSMLHNRANRIQ